MNFISDGSHDPHPQIHDQQAAMPKTDGKLTILLIQSGFF